MQDYKLGAEQFFISNKSKNLESASGYSSSLLNTYYLRDFLKKVFNKYNIN